MIDYVKPKKISYIKRVRTLEPVIVNGVRILRKGESVVVTTAK